MITEKEYKNALRIIKAYESQVIIKKQTNLNDLGLKKGDFVKYIGGSESKYL